MINPKISVIIPVYGAEKYIRKCIESVVNQTLKEIEIIIINDGTRDNSMKIVNEYSDDERIKIINKKNGGISSVRNLGIKEAKGKYIYFIDNDDFIKLDILENLYEKAEKYFLDIVFFDINVYSDKLKKIIKIWQDTNFKEDKIYTGEQYLEQYFLGRGCPSVCNKLCKRDLYIKNNIFYPENLKYGEDGSTLVKLMAESYRIGKVDERGYYYRKSSTSATKEKNIKLSEYLIAYDITIDYLKEKNKNFLKKYLKTYKYTYVYKLLFNYDYNKTKKNYVKKVYKEFFKDIKKIELSNLSLKDKIIVKLYKININLGNFIIKLYLFIKRIQNKE